MGGKRQLRKGDLDPDQRAKKRLRRAFDGAERFYWCNTDRGAEPGENALEKQMRGMRFAAAWVPFVYQTHMRRVRKGDLIFMYANDVGVVAVGIVRESLVQIVGRDNPSRLRAFKDGEHDEEWRIPVRWLVWDESKPCRFRKPLRGTFLELKKDGGRFKKIKRHLIRQRAAAGGQASVQQHRELTPCRQRTVAPPRTAGPPGQRALLLDNLPCRRIPSPADELRQQVTERPLMGSRCNTFPALPIDRQAVRPPGPFPGRGCRPVGSLFEHWFHVAVVGIMVGQFARPAPRRLAVGRLREAVRAGPVRLEGGTRLGGAPSRPESARASSSPASPPGPPCLLAAGPPMG
jgi:hypothetical protein